VLTGTSLGDNAALAHPSGQQCLPQCVIDLMCSGVRQVFAFQVDLRSSERGAEAVGGRQRRGPSDVLTEQPVQLGAKRRIVTGFLVGCL